MIHQDERQPTTTLTPALSTLHSSRLSGNHRINRDEFQAETTQNTSQATVYQRPTRARAPVPPPSRALHRGNGSSASTFDQEDSGQSRKTLLVLREAMLASAQCNRSVWDFAVEITEFTDAGIAKHVLRKLVCLGFIEHQREVPTTGSSRSFLPEKDIVLSERSCFVLKQAGLREATRLAYGERKMPVNHAPNAGQPGAPVPIWDAARRELRLGNRVVKRFKWPAPNQERVLQAFQEQQWMKKIDDPLPPDDQVCSKRRLHDTIKCLNRNQLNKVVKFRGDGTGQGVFWEIRFEELTASSTRS